MIELKKKIYKFNYDGTEYTLTAPTLKQVEKMQKKSKEIGEENAISSTLDFLADLGLPKEVAYEMQPDHLETIVNAVSGVKS
jgi:hypothetical protein